MPQIHPPFGLPDISLSANELHLLRPPVGKVTSDFKKWKKCLLLNVATSYRTRNTWKITPTISLDNFDNTAETKTAGTIDSRFLFGDLDESIII